MTRFFLAHYAVSGKGKLMENALFHPFTAVHWGKKSFRAPLIDDLKKADIISREGV